MIAFVGHEDRTDKEKQCEIVVDLGGLFGRVRL